MAFDGKSLSIFLRRSVGLILTPYATMRRISIESSWRESAWGALFVVLYFLITNTVRFWINGLLGAVGLFLISTLFFSLLPGKDTFQKRFERMYITWSYTLVPTLLWFYITLFFYFLIPPPRTISLLGKSFSIFYIALSVSLLLWKLILVYLSIRFSLRIHLYRVIYYMLIYLALSIPLWLFLYNIGISRIPFV